MFDGQNRRTVAFASMDAAVNLSVFPLLTNDSLSASEEKLGEYCIAQVAVPYAWLRPYRYPRNASVTKESRAITCTILIVFR